MAYLHVTLAISKDQGQGHAYIDCEYIAYGDSTNTAIANASEVTFWLSIGIFTFDLGKF